MSFFEKARAGYEQLAGRAEGAFDSVTDRGDLGDIDQHYRDLGLLAYLAATGRSADPTAQERIVQTLQALEQRGAIRDFALVTGRDAAGGLVDPPERDSAPDAVPQPPPERAGRHGDFLTQTRPPTPPAWAPSDPDETTGPRPTRDAPPPPPGTGGTWGPPPPPLR